MQLTIPTMTCGGCVRAVTQAIRNVSPDAQVEADVPSRRVTVTGVADAAAVRAALDAAGFPAERS